MKTAQLLAICCARPIAIDSQEAKVAVQSRLLPRSRTIGPCPTDLESGTHHNPPPARQPTGPVISAYVSSQDATTPRPARSRLPTWLVLREADVVARPLHAAQAGVAVHSLFTTILGAALTQYVVAEAVGPGQGTGKEVGILRPTRLSTRVQACIPPIASTVTSRSSMRQNCSNCIELQTNVENFKLKLSTSAVA